MSTATAAKPAPKRIDVSTLRRLPTAEKDLKLAKGRLARMVKAQQLQPVVVDGVAHVREADYARLQKATAPAAAAAAKKKPAAGKRRAKAKA